MNWSASSQCLKKCLTLSYSSKLQKCCSACVLLAVKMSLSAKGLMSLINLTVELLCSFFSGFLETVQPKLLLMFKLYESRLFSLNFA